jgi:hypothetical protein
VRGFKLIKIVLGRGIEHDVRAVEAVRGAIAWR